jgi:hypothetical protein
MGEIKKIHRSPASDGENADGISEDLKEALREFRDSIHAASDRPGFFWKKQHEAIMVGLDERVTSAKRRPVLLWGPAALVVLMCCLFFFVQNSKAPTPDLAAGSDQNLLIEVERALSQGSPTALAPAAFLENEIEQANKER